jgi:hypothetical protein
VNLEVDLHSTRIDPRACNDYILALGVIVQAGSVSSAIQSSESASWVLFSSIQSSESASGVLFSSSLPSPSPRGGRIPSTSAHACSTAEYNSGSRSDRDGDHPRDRDETPDRGYEKSPRVDTENSPCVDLDSPYLDLDSPSPTCAQRFGAVAITAAVSTTSTTRLESVPIEHSSLVVGTPVGMSTQPGVATTSTLVASAEPWFRQTDRNPRRRRALVLGAARGNVSNINDADT